MRLRLKTKFVYQGRVYQPGEIVDLPDGVRGPHRAVTRTPDAIDFKSRGSDHANHLISEVVDEPLYEELPDENTVAE